MVDFPIVKNLPARKETSVSEIFVKDQKGTIHLLDPESVEVLKLECQGATLYTGSRVVRTQQGVEELLHELPLMLLVNEGVPGVECWVNPEAVMRIVEDTPTQLQMRSGRRLRILESAVELRQRKRQALRDRRYLNIAS